MSAVGALVWCRGRRDRPVGRWVITGRKDPRLGASTVSLAVHDPERDHRGDGCPATLATRDGQPSQPGVACLSMHAARLPRRTRSSPWLTALALGGARVVGTAELAAQAAGPRTASSNGSRRVWPDVSAMPRGGPTRAGPPETSCTGSRRRSGSRCSSPSLVPWPVRSGLDSASGDGLRSNSPPSDSPLGVRQLPPRFGSSGDAIHRRGVRRGVAFGSFPRVFFGLRVGARRCGRGEDVVVMPSRRRTTVLAMSSAAGSWRRTKLELAARMMPLSSKVSASGSSSAESSCCSSAVTTKSRINPVNDPETRRSLL